MGLFEFVFSVRVFGDPFYTIDFYFFLNIHIVYKLINYIYIYVDTYSPKVKYAETYFIYI